MVGRLGDGGGKNLELRALRVTSEAARVDHNTSHCHRGHVKPFWRGWDSGLCPRSGQSFPRPSSAQFPRGVGGGTGNTHHKGHILSWFCVFLPGKTYSVRERNDLVLPKSKALWRRGGRGGRRRGEKQVQANSQRHTFRETRNVKQMLCRKINHCPGSFIASPWRIGFLRSRQITQ